MSNFYHSFVSNFAVGSRLETSASLMGLSMTPGRSMVATPGSSIMVSIGNDFSFLMCTFVVALPIVFNF